MTIWRYYLHKITDLTAATASWPADKDTGEKVVPAAGCMGRMVMPGTMKSVKDTEDRDVSIFEPSKTAKGRYVIVAVREDDRDTRDRLSVQGTLVRLTRQNINAAKGAAPGYDWDSLGSFAGVKIPTHANEYPED